MDLGLKDKVALVTGGNRGIGKSVARTLAREGMDVVIAARNREALDQAAQEIGQETGRRIVPLTVDTSDDASVKQMVDQAVQQFGHVDVLVNCAAQVNLGGAPGIAGLTNDAFWNDVNVKVLGYLRVAREVAPHMIRQGSGRIVNVSGLAARRTGSIVGSVRNVAVVAASKNLADELGKHGISVNVVHPGTTRTETRRTLVARAASEQGSSVEEVERRQSGNVLQRMIDADEVADVVAFLASPRAIAINGDVIDAGGGAPGSIYY